MSIGPTPPSEDARTEASGYGPAAGSDVRLRRDVVERTVPPMVAFARWSAAHGAPIPPRGEEYAALWRWSVEAPAGFWSAIRDYFEVPMEGRESSVLTGGMPGTRWFPGTRLNYVESVFRDRPPDGPALIAAGEGADGRPGEDAVLTWSDLARQVAAVAATLRRVGVRRGDRVVGYLPDVAEAVVAFLATASIGAVWASCGQDYTAAAAAARFAQLRPVVLISADGYRFGGVDRDRRGAAADLLARLPTVRGAFLVPRLGGGPVDGFAPWESAASDPEVEPQAAPAVDRVPFDHPLWVLFSSGTTGRPKGLVHGHGGVLLEHLKSLGLHLGIGRGDRFTWYSSPSWMVWNYRTSALLLGATVVCYDGSATAPSTDVLWSLAARLGVTFLGASPGYLAACEAAGITPGTDHDLTGLRGVGSSGSHLPAAAYGWVAEHAGRHIEVQSTSGGTDVVSAFAGGAPILPVRPGELSGPCLGVALDSWDAEGRSVRGQPGELVITAPMPSMPLYLWDDHDGQRYRDAYFSVYPGVWRHGDWVTITDSGSVVVNGRSDSTLNRHGVRMGSAEIYQAVATVPQVADALVVGVERSDGGYWMPLFVTLAAGHALTDDLTDAIRAAIRRTASPRHVPDDVVAVEALPHTITGKKLEVPVKRILQGVDVAVAADPGSVDDPALLSRFARYRADRVDRERPRSSREGALRRAAEETAGPPGVGDRPRHDVAGREPAG